MRASRHVFSATVLAVVITAAGLSTLAAQTTKPAPIKIGAILSLTGPGAGNGIPDLHGVQFAVKVINQRGGVSGRPLELVVADDATSPDTAISKANALVYTEKVKAVIGGALIALTDAMATVTQPAKIPQVAITGQGPAIELTYPYLFHISPTFEQHAQAVLGYIAKGAHVKRIGVLYDSGYGRFVFENIQKLAPSYGVQIVGAEKFEVAATDATSQAAKVRDMKPDIVVIVASSAVPFRNAKQVGIQQLIVSAPGGATYENGRAMGDAGDNIVFGEYLVGEDPLPHQAEFVRLYKAEYGVLPKGFEGLGWDAAQTVFKAIEQVGPDATPPQIGDALFAVSSAFRGVTGTRDFRAPDRTGYKLSSFVFSKLVKREWTRLDFRISE